MKLNEETAIYEHETFGCTLDEHRKKIEKYFKEVNLDYTIQTIPFNARRKGEWTSTKDYEDIKNKLDKNYTYIVGTTYNEDDFYKRVMLYVSIYKNDNEHALLIHNKKAKMYREVSSFPKKYNEVIELMLQSIEKFRI